MSRNTLALVAAGLALAVGGIGLGLALGGGGSSTGGPLAQPREVANSFGLPIAQQQAISLGVFDVVNRGEHPAVVDDAVLVDPGAGIELLGAYILPMTDSRQNGTLIGFEPKGARLDRPISAGERVHVVVGLKVVRPGRYTFRAIALRYHAGGHRYQNSFPVSARLCAPIAKYLGHCPSLITTRSS